MSVSKQRKLAYDAYLERSRELDRRLFGAPTTPHAPSDVLRIKKNIVTKYVWDVVDSLNKESDWVLRSSLPWTWHGYGNPPRLYDSDSDDDGEWTWEQQETGWIAGLGGSFIKDVQGWRRVKRAPRTRGSFSGNFNCMDMEYDK